MVTIFLAQGFEEMEALAPLDLLRRAGIPVQTAAVTDSPLSADEKAADRLVVTGSHGVRCVCELAAEQVTEEQMQMLVLPGGMPGTKHLGSSPLVDRWLRYAQQKGVFIGAICAAPSVLGEKGMLQDRSATAFPGFEPKGAICTGQGMVRDGQYITAKGAGVCIEFGLELVSCLAGEATARQIKEEIQCQR